MTPATHPYAQLLGDRDPLEVLAETEKSIPAFAQKLGVEGLKRSYAPGKWSGAEILSHLADCEIAFGFRLRQVIAEPEQPIQPFDENLWAKRYCLMDGFEAVKTFQSLRAWNLSLFRLLTKEDLEKSASHPERGPQSADAVIRIMAGHTLNHAIQLEKIISG